MTLAAQEQAIRRAAILVATLSAQEADALLDQMPESMASQVRNAVMNLEDVSQEETQQVLDAFLGQQVAADEHANGDKIASSHAGLEIDPSLAAKLQSGDHQPTVQVGKPEMPTKSTEVAETFEFLSQANAEVVCRLLEREHPQIAAVVLSRLPAERAAEIVQALTPNTQVEVLTRVAHADDLDDESLHAVAETMKLLLADQLQPLTESSRGVQTVANILKSIRQNEQQQVLANVGKFNEPLAGMLGKQLGQRSSREVTPEPPAGPAAREPLSKPHPSLLEFHDIQLLAAKDLARVLESAGPELMLLALAGANRSFVDNLLGLIPARYARLLRKRIEQLGPTQLNDLAIAQQKIARLASKLIEDGVIRPPKNKRFAVAA